MSGYLGMDHDRGCHVIWNVINVSHLEEEQIEKLYYNLLSYKDLKHENINTISDVWLKDECSLVFITDSFFGGSIRQYLYKIGIQKLKVIKSWLKMILLGMDYLHKNGLIMRDLNCSRIYLNNNNGVVSIGDLFVSSGVFYKSFNEKEFETFSPNCMAPEIIKDQSISEKSDIYSLGMVLIEMITIETPYADYGSSVSTVIQKIKEGVKPSIFERISDEGVKQFILRLIDPDPSKRPSVQQLLEDEFLKINDKEDNRKIKLIKIKKRKKKKDKDANIDSQDSQKKRMDANKKKIVPLKKDFEEVPYFEEPIKKDKTLINLIDTDLSLLPNKNDKLRPCRKSTKMINHDKQGSVKKESILNNSSCKKESLMNTQYTQNDLQYAQYAQYIPTSSHECYTIHSDVYHTANTDYFNNPGKNIKEGVDTARTNKEGRKAGVNSNPEQTTKIASDKGENKPQSHSNLNSSHHTTKPYQIFDSNYNVQVKFFINQESKLHEIQFTYNLLRDSIPELMEEIQNEFNFTNDNLNHIYETLKKISIYSKFYKKSDILHDNSF